MLSQKHFLKEAQACSNSGRKKNTTGCLYKPQLGLCLTAEREESFELWFLSSPFLLKSEQSAMTSFLMVGVNISNKNLDTTCGACHNTF